MRSNSSSYLHSWPLYVGDLLVTSGIPTLRVSNMDMYCVYIAFIQTHQYVRHNILNVLARCTGVIIIICQVYITAHAIHIVHIIGVPTPCFLVYIVAALCHTTGEWYGSYHGNGEGVCQYQWDFALAGKEVPFWRWDNHKIIFPWEKNWPPWLLTVSSPWAYRDQNGHSQLWLSHDLCCDWAVT